MTPKEKCKELLHKMNNVDLNCENESMCMLYPHAIECVLIAVDEILNLIDGFDLELTFNYYLEVKDEILTIKHK
jgi:hypothetical protein